MMPPLNHKLFSGKNKFIYILLLLGILRASLGQQISVSTQVLPPYSQYISDYQSRPGQIVITLINTTRQSYQVQLVGSITGDNGVSIRTKADYRSASPVTVNPGASVRVSSSDIMQLFDDGALDYSGTSADDIVRKNTLPEGLYQICVQALDYQSHQPLSAAEPQGCSAPFPLQSLEPPMIIRPADVDIVNVPLGAPQNIIFTWSTPASAPPSTQYNLKIFEHFDPNRNPNDVIRTAGLALFDQNIRGNSFLYGPGQPQLKLGRGYIAVIQAVDLTRRSSVFRNEGFSEPVSFQYGVETTSTAGGGTPPNPPADPVSPPSNIPATQIKGKILWSFKQSMAIKPIGPQQQPTYFPDFSVVETAKYAMDINYNGLNNPVPSAPAPQNMMFVNSNFLGPQKADPINKIPNAKVGGFMVLGGVNDFQATVSGKNRASNIISAINATGLLDPNLNEKYPLVDTKISIYAIKSPVPKGTTVSNIKAASKFNVLSNISIKGYSDKVLIGAAITDAAGNFTVEFLNPSLFSTGYDKMTVEINSKDFNLPHAEYPMPTVGIDGNMPVIDLNTIFGEAFNYIFIPTLVDDNNVEIKDVDIKIYRKADFYGINPNQQKEGNIQFGQRTAVQEKGISGEVIPVGRQTSSKKIFHLFFNQNFNEKYYVVIKKDGYIPIITDLMVTAIGKSPEVIEIQREFQFMMKLPVVKGTVTIEKDGIKSPVRGATVTMYFDDSWKNAKNPTVLANGFSNKSYLANANSSSAFKKLGGGLGMFDIPNKLAENAATFSKILANIGPVPVSGGFYATKTSVEMYTPILKALGNTMVATTDSNGAYIFTDVPVTSTIGKNYKIITNAPSISATQMDSVLCSARGIPDIVLDIVISRAMVPITGRTVDNKGVPVKGATFKWKSDGRMVEGSNLTGVFLTKNQLGLDTLIITKHSYAEKRIGVNVKISVNNGSKGPKDQASFFNYLSHTLTYQNIINSGNPPDPADFGYNVNANAGQVSGIKNKKGGGPNADYQFVPNYTDGEAENFGGLSPPPDKFTAQFDQMYKAVFTTEEQPEGIMDLGDIVLEQRVGKILFTVKDAVSKAIIPNVKIILPNDAIEGTTNASGQWLIEGPSGNILAQVTTSLAMGYIAKEVEITTKDDGTVTEFIIELDKGVKVTGKVTATSGNIKDANVVVDGRDFINTKSAADGTYSLIVPVGEYTLKASKSGYLGKAETRTFVLGTPQVINFVLGDGGGKDLTKMLGFDIEIEKMDPDGAGSILTGSFINFKPMGPFKVLAGKKLKFTNIHVTWDGAGKPIPTGDKVESTDTQLDFKVFDFLPLRVNRPMGILVKKDASNKGIVQGKIEISVDQIIGSLGVQFPMFKPNLSTLQASVPMELSVFTEDGSFPYGTEFFMASAAEAVDDAVDQAVAQAEKALNEAVDAAKAAAQQALDQAKAAAKQALLNALNAAIAKAQAEVTNAVGADNILAAQKALQIAQDALNGAQSGELFDGKNLRIKLYGFEARINLGKCSISGDGLHLVGALKTTGIPLMGERTFEFEQFHIGSDFSVKSILVKLVPPPTLKITSWSATLNSLGFNENGFKIGGNIKIKVPSSAESLIDFANLLFGKGTVFGGSFTLPTDGVDIFGIVQMKPGAIPLSFGQLNNSSVYYIAGSGKFKIPNPIDYTLNVKSFQIQTDAKFAATVEANINVNLLGVCQIQIEDIGFSTLNAAPEIKVKGAFKLSIPLFKATVGGLHFKPNGSFSMDELGIGFDIVGVAKVAVNIKFLDTPAKKGFEGKGKLNIISTPINASLGFHYYKVGSGIDIGAEFEAGVIIPIGVVTLERVAGGFSLNTTTSEFYVRIEAGASIAGLGAAVKLDPVRVEVWNGPVIRGTVGVVVASVINAATATITIDVPNAYFAVGIDVEFAPLGDFAKARAQGDLIISAKSGNSYFFLGVGFDVNLLGLIQARGGVAIGAGLKDAKNHPRAGYYLADAPDEFLTGGTFSGIYVYGMSKTGVRKEDAWGFDAGILSAKAWLYSESKFHFIANFQNGDFEIMAQMSFGGGVEGCFIGLCAGASVAACVAVRGGRNAAKGWYFYGIAEGSAQFAVGDDYPCNDWSVCCWPGFKVCISAQLVVDYQSNRANHLQLGFRTGGDGVCNN
jgi:TANFOR domain-containing protein